LAINLKKGMAFMILSLILAFLFVLAVRMGIIIDNLHRFSKTYVPAATEKERIAIARTRRVQTTRLQRTLCGFWFDHDRNDPGWCERCGNYTPPYITGCCD
jgi:hypothetical protein